MSTTAAALSEEAEEEEVQLSSFVNPFDDVLDVQHGGFKSLRKLLGGSFCDPYRRQRLQETANEDEDAIPSTDDSYSSSSSTSTPPEELVSSKSRELPVVMDENNSDSKGISYGLNAPTTEQVKEAPSESVGTLLESTKSSALQVEEQDGAGEEMILNATDDKDVSPIVPSETSEPAISTQANTISAREAEVVVAEQPRSLLILRLLLIFFVVLCILVVPLIFTLPETENRKIDETFTRAKMELTKQKEWASCKLQVFQSLLQDEHKNCTDFFNGGQDPDCAFEDVQNQLLRQKEWMTGKLKGAEARLKAEHQECKSFFNGKINTGCTIEDAHDQVMKQKEWMGVQLKEMESRTDLTLEDAKKQLIKQQKWVNKTCSRMETNLKSQYKSCLAFLDGTQGTECSLEKAQTQLAKQKEWASEKLKEADARLNIERVHCQDYLGGKEDTECTLEYWRKQFVEQKEWMAVKLKEIEEMRVEDCFGGALGKFREVLFQSEKGNLDDAVAEHDFKGKHDLDAHLGDAKGPEQRSAGETKGHDGFMVETPNTEETVAEMVEEVSSSQEGSFDYSEFEEKESAPESSKQEELVMPAEDRLGGSPLATEHFETAEEFEQGDGSPKEQARENTGSETTEKTGQQEEIIEEQETEDIDIIETIDESATDEQASTETISDAREAIEEAATEIPEETQDDDNQDKDPQGKEADIEPKSADAFVEEAGDDVAEELQFDEISEKNSFNAAQEETSTDELIDDRAVVLGPEKEVYTEGEAGKLSDEPHEGTSSISSANAVQREETRDPVTEEILSESVADKGEESRGTEENPGEEVKSEVEYDEETENVEAPTPEVDPAGEPVIEQEVDVNCYKSPAEEANISEDSSKEEPASKQKKRRQNPLKNILNRMKNNEEEDDELVKQQESIRVLIKNSKRRVEME